MRDEKFFQMQEMEQRGRAALYRQLQILASRTEAYEIVLDSTWNIMKAVFIPGWLKKSVDMVQMDLIKKHDETMKAAIEKQKQEKAKPKLTIVGSTLVLILSFLMVGCVSKKNYDELQKNFSDCQSVVGPMNHELNTKNERLRKLNQLNEDNSLRTKKSDDRKGWDAQKGANDEL